jgi:phage repressor protein C with HTH and peptisase S24 domain
MPSYGPVATVLVKNLLLAGALVGVAGCATGPGADGPAAPTADVNSQEAWHDASVMAHRDGDRFVLKGGGSSMQPVYGEGTILVLKRIPYDNLRVGMSVAYLDHDGEKVVHQLVAKESGGWRVMGLNNAWIDQDLVTAANLIGVVCTTLYSTDEEP